MGSEVFLHLTSIFLSQFNVSSFNQTQQNLLQTCALATFGLLILLNAVFIVWVTMQDCKEKKRKKALEARKKRYEESLELKKKQKED